MFHLSLTSSLCFHYFSSSQSFTNIRSSFLSFLQIASSFLHYVLLLCVPPLPFIFSCFLSLPYKHTHTSHPHIQSQISSHTLSTLPASLLSGFTSCLRVLPGIELYLSCCLFACFLVLVLVFLCFLFFQLFSFLKCLLYILPCVFPSHVPSHLSIAFLLCFLFSSSLANTQLTCRLPSLPSALLLLTIELYYHSRVSSVVGHDELGGEHECVTSDELLNLLLSPMRVR